MWCESMSEDSCGCECEPYKEVKSSRGSTWSVAAAVFMLSVALLALFFMIIIFLSGDASDLNWGKVKWVAKRVSYGEFRNSIIDVEALVVGLIVAVIALSWKMRERPEASAKLRAWLAEVHDAARRELTSFLILMILAMLFGALTFAYWVSLLGDWRGREVVGGVVVGLSLLLVFIAITLFLSITRMSANGALHNYALLLRQSRKMAQWWIYHPRVKMRGDIASKSYRLFCYVWFRTVCAVPAILVWGWLLWEKLGFRRAAGLVLIPAILVGALACFLALALISFVPEIAFGSSIVFRIILMAVLLLFSAEFFVISLGAALSFGRDWWYQGITFVALRLVATCMAGIWWVVPVAYYGLSGRSFPLLPLSKLGEMRFRRAYKNHVEQYDNYSDKKVEYSSEMEAIEDIVIPEGAVMRFSGPSSGTSESSRHWGNRRRKSKKSEKPTKRPWTEFAEIRVLPVEESRCAGKGAVSVRRYINDELGIILPGGRPEGVAAVSQSAPAPQVRSAVDSWHVSSVFE